MKNQITTRQKELLTIIYNFIKVSGYPPTFSDMKERLGVSSNQSALDLLEKLKDLEMIKKDESTARSISILPAGYKILGKNQRGVVVDIPFKGYIAAGAPIEAVEEHETITVLKTMVAASGEHFALGVKGDSMIDEGIFDGDTVIIRKQNTVENGETAVALINGNEVTLKKIFREKTRIRLQPANPKLKPLYVKAIIIQGKVISAIRNLETQERKDIEKIKEFDGQSDMVNKIIVGDCLDVMKKIKDNTFDIIFADPPYNMQLQNELYRPNNTRVNGVDDAWDKFGSFEHYDDFSKAWLKEAKRILKKNGTIWVIGSYHNIFRVGNIMQDLGYWVLNDIHWIKANPMPNFKGVRFTNATETIIWAVKDKKVKNYTFNYEEMKKYNQGKQMRNDWYFSICNGTERLKDENGVKVHSTQKPLPLLERIILASTKKGDLVFDPFGGTCTTGVAAYKHGRNFTMVEKDENYVDWALKRFKNFRNQLTII